MEVSHKPEPKFRKQLNQNQVAILTLLYRFRFGTTELLADSLGKTNPKYVHPRLATLVQQGFIGSRYESSYRLQGKHAAYYILPKGLRALQTITERDDIDDATIKNSYKDKTVKEPFINHHLEIYAIHNQLKALYPDIKLFTKRELTIYDYFPKALPDAYISLKVRDETRRLFLELFDDSTPPFVVDRRIREFIEYEQNGEWQAKGSPFPPILCICETGSLEKRLNKQLNRALYRADEDMLFYTTTQNALTKSNKGDDAIWSTPAEPERLFSLTSLIVNP